MARKKSQKSLAKWSKQNWGYVTKGDEKKPKEKAASNRKKRKAGGVGSRAKYSRKVRKAVRNA